MRVDIPFVREIGTAAGVHRMRPVLFVRVVGDTAEGWGECAALADPTSVDPGIDDVERAARERGVPRLLGAAAARSGALPSSAEVPQLFAAAPVDRQLAAAFEMAVWDAELRAEDQSMASSLGVAPGFETLPIGAVVGIPSDRRLDSLLADVARVLREGASRLRVKIEPGWETAPVQAIREARPGLVLQVDANGSFRDDDDDVKTLSRLADFDVVCVEQPLPPADLVAHAQLAKKLAVPICLDESLTSPRRVQDALRNDACAMACLKPARLGGVRATRAAHAFCAEAGVPTFVGGFFEMGLARASNLALAARLSQDASGLVSDLSAPSAYLEEDPCGYPPVVDGWVDVPQEAGVGQWPDPGALARLDAHRRWFPATYT